MLAPWADTFALMATCLTEEKHLETVLDAEYFDDISEGPAVAPHRDRYAGFIRTTAGVTSGIIAGVLLVNSIQVGVAFALREDQTDWDVLQWADHWMWRGIASLVATGVAGFIAGMIARRRGRLVGSFAAIPSALYWALIAYAGFSGHFPGLSGTPDVPLGYRIVAILLAVATVPCGAACGREGAAYGHANAAHLDARRGTLLGVKWYHFLWLPVLIHLMVMTAAFGGVYGFQWVIAVWTSGMSIFAIVPVVFCMAMFATLQLLGNGALGMYSALAGFDDETGESTLRRVMKFGFGYTLATVLAQSAITVVHFGLGALLRRFFG